jgi:hypothetical protein
MMEGKAPRDRDERRHTVYTRLLGADAEVDYARDLLDAIVSLETRFPAPEFAVIFADSDTDDPQDIDQIIVCRRWGGVLMPAVYLGTDELAEYEKSGFAWLEQIASDIERTEADLEDLIAAEEAGEEKE